MNEENATNPPNTTNPEEVYFFTGQQIIAALERDYNAYRDQLNNLKLQNNRLANPVLIKHTAMNMLTGGQYGVAHGQKKQLRSIPIEYEECCKVIRDMENKYTQPPHITELCKQMKTLEYNYNHTIQFNNKYMFVIEDNQKTLLEEKKKLQELEKVEFMLKTKDVKDLFKDSDYQKQVVIAGLNLEIEKKRKMFRRVNYETVNTDAQKRINHENQRRI